MNTRQLGKTDARITEIGLGTNAVGGHNLYAGISEEEGIRLVERAVELGINFFDTADVYGTGRSEELTGKALGPNKNDVFIATKGGNLMGRDGADNSPAYLREALEGSLRRLNRDYIDLYYIHKPDGKTPPEEAFGTLMRFKEEGKIRFAGVSNFSLEQLQQAMKAGPVDAIQNEFHLFHRAPETDIIPFCEQHGISFIPWGPIAFGLLTDSTKYNENMQLAENDWRRNLPYFSAENFPETLRIRRELKTVAQKREVPLSHLAMRWVLSHPAVASTITGAKNEYQVEENARAVGWDLDAEELARIDEITGAATS